MRDLKREYNYSIGEQEEMLPFERSFLLTMIEAENLKNAEIPEQGWKKYAEDIGATKKWNYTKNFRQLDY